jgi:hypothetical protein
MSHDYDFDKTREALKRYFEHDDTFDESLEKSLTMSNKDAGPFVDEWFDKQETLKLEAGKEFCRATKAINSMDHANHVSIDFMVRMTKFERT